MYIIMGGTGHVGLAVAHALLAQGQAVTIISRNAGKADAWIPKGSRVALADVHDTTALQKVFRTGKRLFLLNPPAAPTTDMDTEERQSVASVLKALEGSGLEKIVALSTYGAQPGSHIGDLGVLYEMEQGLARQPIPATIIRAAYFMSNWEMALTTAQQQGRLFTFFPPDFKLPMVSPGDVGLVAANLLMDTTPLTGLYYVEGPAQYSSAEVVSAFSAALGKQVQTVQIQREQWIPTLTALGFSQAAAESMAAMTGITLGQAYDLPGSPLRGTTTLQAFIKALVEGNKHPNA